VARTKGSAELTRQTKLSARVVVRVLERLSRLSTLAFLAWCVACGTDAVRGASTEVRDSSGIWIVGIRDAQAPTWHVDTVPFADIWVREYDVPERCRNQLARVRSVRDHACEGDDASGPGGPGHRRRLCHRSVAGRVRGRTHPRLPARAGRALEGIARCPTKRFPSRAACDRVDVTHRSRAGYA